MKKTISLLLLIALLAIFLASPASASHGEPAGGCPPQFELHHFMDHDNHDHHHRHIGVTEDLNQDGYICVKHVSQDLHAHADNFMPLK
jgi:hypothetical protein